jgi:site-specific DNA recombinase
MIGPAVAALIERMDTTSELDQRDLLDRWVRRTGSRAAGQEGGEWGRGRLRFAFYGRTSTMEYQDRSTSRAWQREVAESVIADQGLIVAEFFDVGCSRRVSWVRRPRAAAVLEALSSTESWFDAIVVGEYERAFYGEQFTHLALVFHRRGV